MATKEEFDNKVVDGKISHLSRLDRDTITFFFESGYAHSSIPVEVTKKLLDLNLATKIKSYVSESGILCQAINKAYFIKLNYFGLMVRKKLKQVNLGDKNESIICR